VSTQPTRYELEVIFFPGLSDKGATLTTLLYLILTLGIYEAVPSLENMPSWHGA